MNALWFMPLPCAFILSNEHAYWIDTFERERADQYAASHVNLTRSSGNEL
jgi:hypothetical protein